MVKVVSEWFGAPALNAVPGSDATVQRSNAGTLTIARPMTPAKSRVALCGAPQALRSDAQKREGGASFEEKARAAAPVLAAHPDFLSARSDKEFLKDFGDGGSCGSSIVGVVPAFSTSPT